MHNFRKEYEYKWHEIEQMHCERFLFLVNEVQLLHEREMKAMKKK